MPSPHDSLQSASGHQVRNAGRHNIYRNIHKALRARMMDALIQVGQQDDAGLSEAVASRVTALLDACMLHLNHENDFIHPAIVRLSPAGCRKAQEEHEQHAASVQELRVLLHKVRAGTADMAQLYDSLALFVADNLQHMDHEEQVMNGVLWQLFTDAQIAAIEREMVGSMTPAQAQDSLLWMLPSINATERERLLQRLQSNWPAERLRGLLTALQAQLSEAQWRPLQATLLAD